MHPDLNFTFVCCCYLGSPAPILLYGSICISLLLLLTHFFLFYTPNSYLLHIHYGSSWSVQTFSKLTKLHFLLPLFSSDTTSVAETRLNNPSLGDGASVGGLTGLSLSVSGSHMERCGMSSTQRDNMSDNASTTALAGTSITGSLSGSCYNR